MRRRVANRFEMSFERAGGSVMTARVDVWRAADDKWQHVHQLAFDHPLIADERLQATLESGEYTCVFQCYVEESLNGRYDFTLNVNKRPTFLDKGDVNTTAAKNDSKVYKDQFVLDVQAEGAIV